MRTVPMSLRNRMADAIRSEWPDVSSFKVLDVVEARSGFEVLVHFASGANDWLYVDTGFNQSEEV